MTADGARRTREVALLFLRLGVTAFGGPAGHIAMMHDELVRRRRWVSNDQFVDLVGATNLIPGPNSTELAIYVGWDRARGRGLVLAGVCFILPAALMVGVLAWSYVEYGQTPALEGILYGIKPVVIAIVVQALLKLVPTVAKTRALAVLAALAVAAYLAGINELVLLAAGGILAGGWRVLRTVRADRLSSWLPIGAFVPAADVELGRLFLTFLKIGAVLYGSGYVLLAFLQGELVDRLGWLTSEQLLDAVSIGQVTPGPVFTTATFVGYVIGGFWGAVLATIGIFLPSFLFVALLIRLVSWMRSSATLGAVLDGINAAAVGLMAGVSVQLVGDAIIDPLTVAVAVGAGLLLWRTQLNSAWLITGGAAIGLVNTWLGG
ncbi:MAG: chromate efflux transporter [Actinomycetota bacterium]|nr:chromate efflux transporter [Actinomycetota bacterium]